MIITKKPSKNVLIESNDKLTWTNSYSTSKNLKIQNYDPIIDYILLISKVSRLLNIKRKPLKKNLN